MLRNGLKTQPQRLESNNAVPFSWPCVAFWWSSVSKYGCSSSIRRPLSYSLVTHTGGIGLCHQGTAVTLKAHWNLLIKGHLLEIPPPVPSSRLLTCVNSTPAPTAPTTLLLSRQKDGTPRKEQGSSAWHPEEPTCGPHQPRVNCWLMTECDRDSSQSQTLSYLHIQH